MSDGNEWAGRLSVMQRLGAVFGRRRAAPEPASDFRSAEVRQWMQRMEAIRNAARDGIDARADRFIEHWEKEQRKIRADLAVRETGGQRANEAVVSGQSMDTRQRRMAAVQLDWAAIRRQQAVSASDPEIAADYKIAVREHVAAARIAREPGGVDRLLKASAAERGIAVEELKRDQALNDRYLTTKADRLHRRLEESKAANAKRPAQIAADRPASGTNVVHTPNSQQGKAQREATEYWRSMANQGQAKRKVEAQSEKMRSGARTSAGTEPRRTARVRL